MKPLTIIASIALALLFTAGAALAQVHVEGYTKRDGTYVAPHYRSSPNSTTRDNWSTKGNVNPYTGKRGTRNPQPSSPKMRFTQPSAPSTNWFNARPPRYR